MNIFYTKNNPEAESSWISISSLKKESNAITTADTLQTELSLPLNLSSIADWKQNDTNQSIQHTYPEKNSKTYKILMRKISKLNEEINILSHQLKLSNKEIEKLNKIIMENQKENAIKLQFMQEQHEKKLQKTKSNLDFLLNDLNTKTTVIFAEQFMKKHLEEIGIVKQDHEKEIEDLKSHYESELVFKDMEHEKLLNDLKAKFFRYASEIEKRFKKEIFDVKSQYDRELSLIHERSRGDFESDCVRTLDFDFKFKGKNSSFESTRPRCQLKLPLHLVERSSCETCSSTKREYS